MKAKLRRQRIVDDPDAYRTSRSRLLSSWGLLGGGGPFACFAECFADCFEETHETSIGPAASMSNISDSKRIKRLRSRIARGMFSAEMRLALIDRDADREADFAWMVAFACPDFGPSDLIVTGKRGEGRLFGRERLKTSEKKTAE